MLIQNYGLFWEARDVFWGRPKVEGHLNGINASKLKTSPVNFRHQQGVYVLFDDNFRLVYIGQTGAGDQRLLKRLKDHTTDNLAQRWTKFSWFGIRWVKDNGELSQEIEKIHSPLGDVLNHIEAILIAAAEPVHNRQGGKFGEAVVQYLQHRDVDQLGPTSEQMLREMWLKSREA